ncbi:drug/metabolite transporter (DMT)-like permease [Paraburkholderia unamae]|uniref:Drug/metabolite transporter (DMT)-like permease n=1 Tax=Paraburkholderia unamae TaxID=219649 RepID=A0ABX5KKG0_9BURK|nr:drug/metabolite transporter (DMT)-like permease [Paraburkholderia unamae]
MMREVAKGRVARLLLQLTVKAACSHTAPVPGAMLASQAMKRNRSGRSSSFHISGHTEAFDGNAPAQCAHATGLRPDEFRPPNGESELSRVSQVQPASAHGQRAVPDLLLLIALSTLWGASYTFIRIGVATIPPLTLIAARTLIAGSILLLWMRIQRISMPRDLAVWRRFFVQALLNSVVPFTLIAWAERSVEAGLATILNSASPVLAFLGTWLITRHEPLTPRNLFGVVAGLAGICMVVGFSAFEGLGRQLVAQLAIVAATVCYAGAAIYGRAFKGLSPAAPAAGSLIVGAALLVPASLVVDRPWTLHPSPQSLLALVALTIFSTAIAFVIYFRLVQSLGSVGTTAQAYLRVPIGVAISMTVLGESLSASAWLGLGCVVAGVAAMTIPPRQAREQNACEDSPDR